MFSLDRERYNLQNRCVCMSIYIRTKYVYTYIGTNRGQGRTISSEEGARRTAPCCEGVYILCIYYHEYIYIHTFVYTSIYFNILYLYNIHTCTHTQTRTRKYIRLLPRRDCMRCVRAREMCVCIYMCVCVDN